MQNFVTNDNPQRPRLQVRKMETHFEIVLWEQWQTRLLWPQAAFSITIFYEAFIKITGLILWFVGNPLRAYKYIENEKAGGLTSSIGKWASLKHEYGYEELNMNLPSVSSYSSDYNGDMRTIHLDCWSPFTENHNLFLCENIHEACSTAC